MIYLSYIGDRKSMNLSFVSDDNYNDFDAIIRKKRVSKLSQENEASLEAGPLENAVRSKSDFSKISVIHKMLEKITNEDLVYVAELGHGIFNEMFRENIFLNYLHVYPNNINDVIDNPFSKIGLSYLDLIGPMRDNISSMTNESSKFMVNKTLVCSEIVFKNPSNEKKTIEVKSYSYRIERDCFYSFIQKKDLERTLKFLEECNIEFKNFTKKKVYSIDVFPEEAKEIVPKIVKMMSKENFSKLQEYGYHCQFGIVLVGKPGVGKTVFVNHLMDALHEAELLNEEYLFDEIISYGIGDIHRLISNSCDLRCKGLILLDDLDGAITERSTSDGVEGRQTLPWLLTQLDQFANSKNQIRRVIVLCCNKLNYVDSALIRPGRFDRIITFPEPTIDIIKNMVHFVMAHDINATEELKQEITEFYIRQLPNLSLANISLMGRLFYGELVGSWKEAATWSVDRGDSEKEGLILKSKSNNKVGF